MSFSCLFRLRRRTGWSWNPPFHFCPLDVSYNTSSAVTPSFGPPTLSEILFIVFVMFLRPYYLTKSTITVSSFYFQLLVTWIVIPLLFTIIIFVKTTSVPLFFDEPHRNVFFDTWLKSLVLMSFKTVLLRQTWRGIATNFWFTMSWTRNLSTVRCIICGLFTIEIITTYTNIITCIWKFKLFSRSKEFLLESGSR